jgi:hypothetical protein
MKCSRSECQRIAKEVEKLGWIAMEKQMTQCNRCFFSLDPSSRYDPTHPVYRTRNAVGAAYAKAWFSK